MSTLIFQFGDYRAAWRNFEAGGAETYLDQRRSVAFVAARSEEAPVTVACVGPETYDTVIRPGLRAIGGTWAEILDRGPAILADVRPSRVVVSVPHPPLLRAVAAHGAPAYACLADTFRPTGLREMTSRLGLRNLRKNLGVRRGLREQVFTLCGNHSLNASESLVSVLGLPATRVVPWEWSRVVPHPEAKTAPAGGRIFYAGTLSEAKGVGDLIAALGLLVAQGMDVRLEVAGAGEARAQFEAQAAALGDRVQFVGLVPLAEVGARMRAADLVVVPSRHDYAEGLPNVIFEGLASRTPLVVSDHPAFVKRFTQGGVAVFRGGDAGDLARQIAGVLQDRAAYARLSEGAAAVVAGLYVGRSWYEVMERFIADPEDRTGWVEPWSLARMPAA